MAARRRGTLDRQEIARAALALADQRGVDGVTIRAVSERLRVAPMSLYTHVQDKDDLLGAMVELAFEAIDLPDLSSLYWQERLEAILLSIQRVFEQHPSVFVLAYSSSRRIGPLSRLREGVFEALREAVPTTEDAALLYRIIGSYTVGHVFLEQQSYVPIVEGDDTGEPSTEYRDAFGSGDPTGGTEGFLRGLRLILATYLSSEDQRRAAFRG